MSRNCEVQIRFVCRHADGVFSDGFLMKLAELANLESDRIYQEFVDGLPSEENEFQTYKITNYREHSAVMSQAREWREFAIHLHTCLGMIET